MRAAAISPEGEVLCSSEPLRGDLPERELRWSRGDLGSLQGREISLRFALRRARLYSYWIE